MTWIKFTRFVFFWFRMLCLLSLKNRCDIMEVWNYFFYFYKTILILKTICLFYKKRKRRILETICMTHLRERIYFFIFKTLYIISNITISQIILSDTLNIPNGHIKYLSHRIYKRWTHYHVGDATHKGIIIPPKNVNWV